MKFHLKFPKSILALAPYACAAILATLPGACGGGGGSNVNAFLAQGTAVVNIQNSATFDTDAMFDGDCLGGSNTIPYLIHSIRITDTGSGDYEDYTFPADIANGLTSPFSHPIPPGTYSCEITLWTPVHRATTDQCPSNPVIISAGPNTVIFQW